MSNIPEGTILGEGQSWNAQHSYVQTKGSMCDRTTLLAAFASSGAKETLPWLKEQAAKGVAVPPYATFRLWAADKKLKTTPSPSKAPAPAIPTTPEDIKAQIAALQEAYKESLLSKVDRLKVEIEKMQQELAEAEKELEKITA